VSSASDTDLLDAFIEDLFSWCAQELGIVQMATAKPEKFYESSVIVKSAADLPAALNPQSDVAAAMADAMKAAKIAASPKLSGFVLDFDPSVFAGKRKPFRVVVDRRLGVPFSDNIFYSQAPFRTADHLNVLQSFEALALQKPKRSKR
jgi:hypothetical protein